MVWWVWNWWTDLPWNWKIFSRHSIQPSKLKKTVRYGVHWLHGSRLAACGSQKGNGLPPLREHFQRPTAILLAHTYIAYRQLEAMYFRNNINAKTRSFDKTWNEISDTASLYVCISRLFISMKTRLMPWWIMYRQETHFYRGCPYRRRPAEAGSIARKNSITWPLMFGLDSLQHNGRHYRQQLRISIIPQKFFLIQIPYLQKRSGIMMTGGRFYHVCTMERAGWYCIVIRGPSVIILLKGDNYKFLQQAFSFTNNRPDHVYWDEYYRRQFTQATCRWQWWKRFISPARSWNTRL